MEKKELYVMRTSNLIFLTAALISTSAISAERVVETERGIYRLTGDRSAISACAAVINDNVSALASVLRQNKFVFSNGLPVRDFSCNNTNLMLFSGTMGSKSVDKYLQHFKFPTGRVYIDKVSQIQFIPNAVANR